MFGGVVRGLYICRKIIIVEGPTALIGRCRDAVVGDEVGGLDIRFGVVGEYVRVLGGVRFPVGGGGVVKGVVSVGGVVEIGRRRYDVGAEVVVGLLVIANIVNGGVDRNGVGGEEGAVGETHGLKYGHYSFS